MWILIECSVSFQNICTERILYYVRYNNVSALNVRCLLLTYSKCAFYIFVNFSVALINAVLVFYIFCNFNYFLMQKSIFLIQCSILFRLYVTGYRLSNVCPRCTSKHQVHNDHTLNIKPQYKIPQRLSHLCGNKCLFTSAIYCNIDAKNCFRYA